MGGGPVHEEGDGKCLIIPSSSRAVLCQLEKAVDLGHHRVTRQLRLTSLLARFTVHVTSLGGSGSTSPLLTPSFLASLVPEISSNDAKPSWSTRARLHDFTLYL